MDKRSFDLGWMRVFVEAARQGSLSAAAASLRMTQPAASYQVRRAEEEAGFALLRRQHKGVELTPRGRKLFEIVARTVDDIDALMREQRANLDRPAIRLRTDYAISSIWIIPRMHAFRLLHPDTDIQIVATQRYRSDEMEEGDIAIAFGAGGEFGAGAVLLLPEAVVPVCTPNYLNENLGSDGGAARLATTRLIHLDASEPAPWFDWERYLRHEGVSRDAAHQHGDLSFNTYSLVTQAAVENQGVALGWLGLIDTMLRSRVLVPAGPIVTAPDRGYWLVPPRVANAHAEQLKAWLVQETSTVG